MYKKINKIIFPLLLVLISGCAATGSNYQDLQSRIVDAEKVRLVLFRTRESAAASARTTAVKLDGKSVEGVKYAGYTFIDTTPGAHILTVDLPDTYGKCLLPVDVKVGKEYFFQIRPRLESLGLGGAVYAVLADGQPSTPKREDCKGSFYIEQVEASVAHEKLKELKSSN